jgi:diguanylate cyclase (GGDEF)-like protein
MGIPFAPGTPYDQRRTRHHETGYEAVRILVADDDPVSRRLIESTLQRHGHAVDAVADGDAATAALLDRDGPRVAILDWMMPGADGLAVCREVRQHSSTYVYIILLSARDGSHDAATGLDAGADDYLAKPFDVAELLARIRSGQRVLDLQAGLLAAQEALRTEATRDHLTGLWNRRMVTEQLARELNRARHERRPLAVAMVDLDGFKPINDTYGHPAGDAVLRECGAALRSQLREYDFIGRYGGDEFLCVLPGCDAATGAAIAERLRAIIASEPVRIGEHQVSISASLGVASTESAGIEPDALVRAADEALYRAKARGRNCVGQ